MKNVLMPRYVKPIMRFIRFSFLIFTCYTDVLSLETNIHFECYNLGHLFHMLFAKMLKKTQEDLKACIKELHGSKENYNSLLKEKSLLEQKIQNLVKKNSDEVSIHYSYAFFSSDYVQFYYVWSCTSSCSSWHSEMHNFPNFFFHWPFYRTIFNSIFIENRRMS